MKWTGMYLLGFGFVMLGLLLALWKVGALAMLGTFWTAVILIALVGLGIMGAVMNGGRRIEIDRI